MGQDSPSFPSIHHSLPSVIGATFWKYRIIFLGYAVSMALFISSSFFNPFAFLGESSSFMLDRMVFGTMMFSGFMILYLVREQKLDRVQNRLREELRLREGIRLAENEIRNQIIMINQAAYVLSEKQDYDEDIVRIIRNSTLKMDHQLGLLQAEGYDPRDSDADNMLMLF